MFSYRQLAGGAGRVPGRHHPNTGGPGWLETFVGSLRANVATSTLINGWHPRGIIEAVPLTRKQQDDLSFARLRTELLPSDLLNPRTRTRTSCSANRRSPVRGGLLGSEDGLSGPRYGLPQSAYALAESARPPVSVTSAIPVTFHELGDAG